MTGLNLLPRKEFEIILSDGSTHAGKLGTWALARFGQKRKLNLPGVAALLAEENIMDILELIVCSVEGKARETGQPIKFNEVLLANWVDDYQADHKESGFGKLWNYFKDDWDKKKKSQPEEEQLNGQNSNG